MSCAHPNYRKVRIVPSNLTASKKFPVGVWSESCVQDGGADRLRAAGLTLPSEAPFLLIASTPSPPSTPAAVLGPVGQCGEVHHFEKWTQFHEAFSSQPMEEVL